MMSSSKLTNGTRSDGGSLIQALREPLLVLDSGLRVKMAIRSFYETFKVTPEQTLGRFVYELGDGQWKIPALTKLLGELSPTNGEFNSYRVESDLLFWLGARIEAFNQLPDPGQNEFDHIDHRCRLDVKAVVHAC
jgi:hypothetical protein